MNNHTKMYVRMITQSFWHRLSRVLIASLSIAVGAATLAGLGLVAYTVPTQLTQELRSYGANMVVIPTGADGLTDDQLAYADQTIGSAAIARAAFQYANLLYNQQSITVMACDLDDAQAVRQYWSIDGEVPSADDEILVGENVANTYRFQIGSTVGLGEPTVEGEQPVTRNLTVSGILSTGGAEDDLVVISAAGLEAFTQAPASYSIIEYSIDGDSATIATLADQVTTDQMQGEAVRRISENESGIATTLQTLIWMVSVIIVILTIISVSATLNAIVTERSKEFGLKKALGALSKDIMGELIGESVMLGIVGGAIGVAIGIWLADFVSMRAFSIQLQINWIVVPLVLIFSVAVSMIGTLMPARRISKIKPSNVLSGE